MATRKPTGYSHPKCIAQALGDCDLKITREHCIPKSLLSITGDRWVEISGLPGRNGPRADVDRLVAPVACEWHNNIATSLDAEITRFFKTLRNANVSGWTAPDSSFAVFSGIDIERALARMMLCLCAAGWSRHQDNEVRMPNPPAALAKFVYEDGFDRRDWAGLHFLRSRLRQAPTTHIAHRVWLDPNDAKSIVGMAFEMNGFDFAFACRPLPERGHPEEVFEEAWRRPPQLTIFEGHCAKTLRISWPTELATDARPILAEPLRSRRLPES